jgi:hypothetical protein
MNSREVVRAVIKRGLGLGVLTLLAGMAMGTAARAGLIVETDPSQVVPLDKIAPNNRECVAEVIRDHTLHKKAPAETFPCNPRLYLCLLNEPALTLSLWQDLSASPVKLTQVAADRFEGTDGAGAVGSWEFVYRSPKMHVMLCRLDYTTPRGTAKLEARIVLVVHSGFYREVNGDPWVQHDIEAFVKVDSKGWNAVARTVRPIIEKLLEDQIKEAGWFVSLMGRLVATYPTWAIQTATKQPTLPPDTRQRFRELVNATKRPGASNGRPALIDNPTPPPIAASP